MTHSYNLNKINPSTPLRVDAERAKRVESIKFATDEATFKRAVGLYENGKVTEVEAPSIQAAGGWADAKTMWRYNHSGQNKEFVVEAFKKNFSIGKENK